MTSSSISLRFTTSLLLACATVTPCCQAEEFHVAPGGLDTNPGTRSAPFATPAKAIQRVRESVARGLKEDVHVELAAGTYELGAPLLLTAADSGTPQYRITYSAAPDAKVILSGGRRIRNLRTEGSKWTADLSEVREGRWFFRQLIVNGERAIRARWPNEDGALHLATVADEVRSFTFDHSLPMADLTGQDAELVVYENWSVSRALITSFADGRLATATRMGWMGHGDMTTASPGKPVFIEHAKAALDEPGEWFLERKTGTLSYLPRPTDNAANAEVVAPVLTHLLRIEGTPDHPVRNLKFSGIHFEHTDFALPAVGYSEIQAAHYGPSQKEATYVQPVAIECSHAEGLSFENCRFAHLNGSGLGFGPGCRSNSISRCRVEDIGGNGIIIGWRGKGRLDLGPEGSLDADWADPADAPQGNQVVDCLIRRCGEDSRGAVGVMVAFSADTRVAHNEIREMPYTGVSVGYRWNSTPTSQQRCVVEYNHIHDVMRKLADGGGIYTLGFQPGTVLRGNHIHDVHRSQYAHGGAPNNGFFIDEGSKGFLFESNVVHHTSGAAVRFNQTRREWHEWKGNAFDAEATPDRIAAASKSAGIAP